MTTSPQDRLRELAMILTNPHDKAERNRRVLNHAWSELTAEVIRVNNIGETDDEECQALTFMATVLATVEAINSLAYSVALLAQ